MYGGEYYCTSWCYSSCSNSVSYTFDVTIVGICTFTGYASDNALTGQTINYERTSGAITRNFDTITGTTTSSCTDYTAWTYYLSAQLSGSAVTLSDIGMSVDNTNDPAVL